ALAQEGAQPAAAAPSASTPPTASQRDGEAASSTAPAAVAPSAPAAPSAAAPSAAAPSGPPPVVFGGYVEAFYQWNFERPSNALTNFRAFDNHHDTFTLANVAVSTEWDYRNIVGRVALQVGNTPSTYYLAEPSTPGSEATNASSVELWKFIQQAYAGYRFAWERELLVTAGVFFSPTGPESMVTHENWNWSNSNLFLGLPFYHTGVRATYELTQRWALTAAGYNGWNSVVDGNDDKSVALQLTYARPKLSFAALYFGGAERPRGAPEGQGFRQMLDLSGGWEALDWLAFKGHLNAGFEPTEYGVSRWFAGALYARARIFEPLFFALRGDVFAEHVPSNAAGRASPIFWPVPWVSSVTATLDFRTTDFLSAKLEYRHDQAAADMFFGGSVVGDGVTVPFVPNRSARDTVTVGLTSWF
ncbi:MAG TPA: outer membrane beta-barrel protein, partial [Polyangiaceae bacterium]|nr:outer membrane beta-barrel protein [Polyangiaceae bacterium]